MYRALYLSVIVLDHILLRISVHTAQGYYVYDNVRNEANPCVILLMQQCGRVLWRFDVLRLVTLTFGSVSESCLKYLLGLRKCVAEKLPGDGTLVPKHVRAGVR